MIFSIYIYTRSGACLYHEKYQVGKTINYSDPEEEKRLLFGLIFSLKEFVQKVSPTAPTTEATFGADPTQSSRQEGLQRYQTNAYTCHHYETPSGLRFILLTDNNAGDLSTVLKYIYSQIFVEYVVNNPLVDVKANKPIKSQLFHSSLKAYLEGLPCFR
jgi:hypothetical protein